MLGPNDKADAIRRRDDYDCDSVNGSDAIRPANCDRVRARQLVSPTLLFHDPSRRSANATNRVVVVDDHPIFLDGLNRCLRQQGLGVVSETTGAVGSVSSAAVAWLTEVILAGCPGVEDLDAAFFRQLRSTYPGAEALVVLDACTPDLVERLLKAGAMGCIGRDKSVQEFAEAIAVVGRGEIYVEKRIALELVAKWVRFPSGTTTRSRACCA